MSSKLNTAEDRRAARAATIEAKRAKAAAEDLAAAAAEAERKEAWARALPLRILMTMSKMRSLGTVDVTQDECDGNPIASFFFYDDPGVVRSLTMHSDEWEVVLIENTIQGFKDARAAALKKLELARATWDNLTVEQRDALGLKSRP